MIRHFRNRFILISSTALLAVLLTLIGGISALTYYRSQKVVDNVLTMLIAQDGSLNRKAANQQPRNDFFKTQPTREGIFQYRYFSATINNKTNKVFIDDSHIMTVPPATIRTFAQQVKNTPKLEGNVYYQKNAYAYRIKKTKKQTLIVFLDKSTLTAETREIIRFTVIVGIISMILYTGLLIGFSKRAIRPIIQAEKRQKEFITNAGHELKTPLTIISANTEMQEMLSGETELTTSNKQQVTRLTRLVNELISLARMEEHPQITLTAVNATDTVTEIANSFRGVADQNSKKLEAFVDDDIQIKADQNYFYELVNILLDNAVKYCDEQGTISITLHKNPVTKNAILTVANTYAAGKDQDYTKFFDRFYRGDSSHHSHNKTQTGFGIGLSMAQRIVALFKGKIQANYKDGQLQMIVTLKA